MALINRLVLIVPDLDTALASYQALGLQISGAADTTILQYADGFDQYLANARTARLLLCDSPKQYLDLIEKSGPRGSAFAEPGWSAIEVLTNDLDQLCQNLPLQYFSVLGPPATLSFSEDIRAMQVVGSAGELIYFTEINGKIPGFDLPVAHRLVDQCFVTIAGSARLDRAIKFYSQLFDVSGAISAKSRVVGLSVANNLPQSTQYNIATIPVGPGQLIELDQMPVPITSEGGQTKIMSGWNCVSFQSSKRPVVDGMIEPSYFSADGQACFLLRGPDAELIEWIVSA